MALSTQVAELEAEVVRLKELIRQDKTGLADALAQVRRIACGFDWVCEGRGPYEYDDDRYRMEVADLITQVVKVAGDALSQSGTRVTEAFHPRAIETHNAFAEACDAERARKAGG